VIENPDQQLPRRILCAATGLLMYDRLDHDRWDDASDAVVEALVQTCVIDPQAILEWVRLLEPIKEGFRAPLRVIANSADAHRSKAATEIHRAMFPE
jgi:hypothetical protein